VTPGDLTEASPGRLVRTVEDLWAFVPNALPPPLSLSPALAARLERASRAVGELKRLAESIPAAHLMRQGFVHREAVLSSRIEGTTTTVEQLAYFEADAPQLSTPGDAEEVSNYIAALAHGMKRLQELPVSLRLIREMHALLLRGVRGQQYLPGEFRRVQNQIGRPPSYVPPPVTDMLPALEALEVYIHTEHDFPLLVKLALVHYQFEAIHPFMDGNGRMGRLLVPLLLHETGMFPEPLLHLSAYFERNRDGYIGRLLRVSQRGEWTEWVQFFLEGVIQEAANAMARIERLMALRESYRERLPEVRSVAVFRLIDRLFQTPAISRVQARAELGLTDRGAGLVIQRLLDAGIVREATGHPRNRVYVAPDVVRELSD
jgi:Fic family protein